MCCLSLFLTSAVAVGASSSYLSKLSNTELSHISFHGSANYTIEHNLYAATQPNIYHYDVLNEVDVDVADYERDEVHRWCIGTHSSASPEQRARLRDLLIQKKSYFAYSLTDLKGYSGPLGDAELVLKTDASIWTKHRRYGEKELAIIDKKCQEMLDAGIIEPSMSSIYASAPTLPAKKDPLTGLMTDTRF
jgi:hypothetical protein